MDRREFLGAGAALFAATALGEEYRAPEKSLGVGGFEVTDAGRVSTKPWQPFSDRKVRVGIAGEGVCEFGSQFGYQNHPNVEVVACTDLDPKRCAKLQGRVGAKKAYPSCEEMIRHAAEDKLEAVYIATDAPSHVTLAILALEHGLHVASAVPALLGKDQLEYVPRLLDAVKRSGRLYQMNETTAFRGGCYEMRKIYEAGGFGEILYAEGEYYHCSDLKGGLGVGSYRGWRDGIPPQYYATHSNGFYTCVTHKRFTEVTCLGKPSALKIYRDGQNRYGNPYGSEFALYRTEEGGAARMLVAYDTPSECRECGRVYGQKGSYGDLEKGYLGDAANIAGVDTLKPQLPPGMPAGGHGGSHGYLTDDFIRGILVPGHKVCADVVTALNTTIAGVYAHLSAMKGGETLKIPAVV